MEEASELEAETEYDPETDFKFYRGGGKKILATEGMFYILFPQDAHRCRGMAGKEGEKYRKIVLKLPVETKRKRWPLPLRQFKGEGVCIYMRG
mgnify:CR=1 FL=1